MSKYGIARLASRINDLKRDGWLISDEWVTVKNRYGKDVHVKRYRIKNAADDGANIGNGEEDTL